MNRKNVRMIKRRGGARFLLESSQSILIFSQGSRKEFQRDLAMQLGVLCQIDSSHATFAKQRKDTVMRHHLAGFEFYSTTKNFCRRFINGRVQKVACFFV